MGDANYTVLIVEDRADLVISWKREFKFLNRKHKTTRFEVHSAASFSEAREKCLDGVDPNLAIIDHNIKGADKTGYDVCLFLLSRFPEIDIVVNTGYSGTIVHEISDSPSTRAKAPNFKVHQLYSELKEQYPDNVRFTEKFGVRKQIIEQLKPVITKHIVRDAVMDELRNLILTASPVMEHYLKSMSFHAEDPVLLLTGEEGAGKTYLAKALYKARRKLNMTTGPFITVKTPAEKGALRENLREGATVLLKDISRFSEEEWSALAEAVELFEREVPSSGSESPMLVLTDLESPLDPPKGKERKNVYDALAHCSVRVPDLRDRPEDVPILAGTFVARFNAERGTKYFLNFSAQDHLKSGRFQGSTGDLKKIVDGVMRIAQRQRSIQLSSLHFEEAWKNLAALKKRFSKPLKAYSETSSAPSGQFERNNAPNHKIQDCLDAVKLIKSDLSGKERVTTKMVDEHTGKNSGGKATVSFMNRYPLEIASFLENNLPEYQIIVPDMKQMCRKVSDELLRKGI